MEYRWAALMQNSWFVALLITSVMQYIVPGEPYYLWSVRYTCASLIFQNCLMISDRSKPAFDMQHSRPLEVGRYHASERFCSFFKLHTWLKVRCKCQVHSDNSENSNYQNVSVAHRKFDSNHCEVCFFYVMLLQILIYHFMRHSVYGICSFSWIFCWEIYIMLVGANKPLKAAEQDQRSSSTSNPSSSQSSSVLRKSPLFVWVCMCQTGCVYFELCSARRKVHDGGCEDGWRPWGPEDSGGFLRFTKPSQHSACCPLSL